MLIYFLFKCLLKIIAISRKIDMNNNIFASNAGAVEIHKNPMK